MRKERKVPLSGQEGTTLRNLIIALAERKEQQVPLVSAGKCVFQACVWVRTFVSGGRGVGGGRVRAS